MYKVLIRIEFSPKAASVSVYLWKMVSEETPTKRKPHIYYLGVPRCEGVPIWLFHFVTRWQAELGGCTQRVFHIFG